MCLFCVSDHSKYFLKNLLRGWEKLTWSQTPAPPCLDFFPILTIFLLKASLIQPFSMNTGFLKKVVKSQTTTESPTQPNPGLFPWILLWPLSTLPRKDMGFHLMLQKWVLFSHFCIFELRLYILHIDHFFTLYLDITHGLYRTKTD